MNVDALHTKYPWINHHAVLFVGDRAHILESLADALVTRGSWSANPDIVYMAFEDMGVDDARALRVRASELPIALPIVTFVIVARSMTRETQNALLKLFEDPPRTARFFVVLPSADTVIPTLLSRFHVVKDLTDVGAPELLPSLATMGGLTEKLKDNDTYRRALCKSLARERTKFSNLSFHKALLLLLSYTDRKGASQKMLFENALLSLREATSGHVAKGGPDR